MKKEVRKLIRESINLLFEEKYNTFNQIRSAIENSGLHKILKDGILSRIEDEEDFEYAKEREGLICPSDWVIDFIQETGIGGETPLPPFRASDELMNYFKKNLPEDFPIDIQTEDYNILFKAKPKSNILNEGFDFGKFIDNPSDAIASIKTCDELKSCIKDMTCGHHFPFNPPEPLRTDFRKKMEELREVDPENFKGLEFTYNIVAGEFKPTPPLPPGAMY